MTERQWRGVDRAAVGVDGHGWLAGLRVAAGRGPALDLACVCAPARGLQLVGVQVADVWPCLPSCGRACPRGFVLCGLGEWGLGLGWGCVIDVEWMLEVRAVLAACVRRPAHRSFAQADIS